MAMQALALSPSTLPVDNLGLQLAKVGHALCSGAYSFPPESPSEAGRPLDPVSRIPGSSVVNITEHQRTQVIQSMCSFFISLKIAVLKIVASLFM